MPVKYKRYLTYFIILGILFAVRIYRLEQAPMADYDSVKNYTIAKELAEGEVSSLFHRRIPAVHFINSLFYRISSNFLFLEYVHALISTLAILIFCVFIQRKFHLNLTNLWIMSLILGLSTIGVAASRYMSIESWTLLLFVLFLTQYIPWIEKHEPRKLLWSTVYYSLALMVNYKFLFILPVFAGIEIWVSRNYYRWIDLVRIVSILLIPYLVFSLIGLISGHGPLLYAKSHLSTLIQLGSTGTFNPDLLFYPRFLIDFENPVLIVTLIWACWFYRKDISQFRKRPTMMAFFLIFTLAYLILISITRKAPRALLFIDVLLHLNLYLFLTGFIKRKWITTTLVLLTVIFSVIQINRNIYQYAVTSYDQMAEVIHTHKIERIILTTGINIVPFLQEVEWRVIFDDSKIQDLMEEGYTHILVDDYHILTGMNEYKLPENSEIITTYQEPSLYSPILALEHAEFVRIGYGEALLLSKKVSENPRNLRLIILSP